MKHGEPRLVFHASQLTVVAGAFCGTTASMRAPVWRRVRFTWKATTQPTSGGSIDPGSFRGTPISPSKRPASTARLGGMQDDDVALEGLRRAVAALEDLDTVGALKPAI